MSAPGATPVLVLHDVADPAGGAPWEAAFEAGGWPGPVVAPDLPGHGRRPAPTGGSYELADAAFAAVRALADAAPADPPVVVGVGLHGWAAEILALGGRAAGLVLVDGLHGPWVDPATAVEAGRRWLRSVAADPAALAAAPAGHLDPRLEHRLVPHGDRRLAERAAAGLTVPVLVIESAASPLAAAGRDEVVGRMADATVVELIAGDPTAVAGATSAWWSAR